MMSDPVGITIFDDLQHISCLAGCQRLWSPIVQYQQFDAGERSQQSGVARVAVRDGQVGEQPGNAGVEDGYVFSTRLVAERARQPTLAQAAQANDIPPANTSSRSSSNTLITRLRDFGFRSFAAVSMRVWCTSWWMARTGAGRCCPDRVPCGYSPHSRQPATFAQRFQR